MEVGEFLFDDAKFLALELVAHGFDDVFEGPSGHRGVERHDDEGAEHAHVADDGPSRAGTQQLERPDGVLLGASSDNEIAEHHWDAEAENDQEVNQKEGSTPIVAKFAGEPIDVAQAHGRSGGRCDDAQFGPETVTTHKAILVSIINDVSRQTPNRPHHPGPEPRKP